MSGIHELLRLRDFDVDEAMAYLGTDQKPTSITGYGSLRDIEDVSSKERGIRFFVQDGRVRLVYLSGSALPASVSAESMSAEYGTGEVLRSRQGRRGELHVVAEAGIAWSEMDGEIGFLELFPPTSFARYKDEIYEEPPAFRQ